MKNNKLTEAQFDELFKYLNDSLKEDNIEITLDEFNHFVELGYKDNTIDENIFEAVKSSIEKVINNYRS